MSELRIGNLVLPVDAASGRYVILGKSGAGKTNGDAVLTEEFVGAGITTIVLDPLGNMRGLRSSADGESAGLPMAIFGGEHGDLPLPADRGDYIADIVSEGVSAVLDMLDMDPDEQVKFAQDFLQRLIQRARINLHVVLEEADRFAPNKVGKNPIVMFARTSRNKGIGWTFSTQKPQILHHDVVDSASVFIAMKMTGELAQDAIGGEIGSRIGKKTAAGMIGDLPKFGRGEAWFVPDSDWLGADAPEWEPQRFRFRLRDTFAILPPKVGEARREPKVLADVDLERLRAALHSEDEFDADAAARAVVPSHREQELRVEIAELRAEIDRLKEAPPVEVPVIPARVLAIAKRLAAEAPVALGLVEQLSRAVEDAAECGNMLQNDASALVASAEVQQKEPRGARKYREVQESTVPTGDAKPLKAGARRMLAMLARCGGMLTKQQLATLADVNRASGTFSEYLSSLRTPGYIEDDAHTVTITAAGAKAIGAEIKRNPPTAAQIVEMFAPKLKAGARRMLDHLVSIYPESVSKKDFAVIVEVNRASGTFSEYLGSLRKNGLSTDTTSHVKASDTLFIRGGRAR